MVIVSHTRGQKGLHESNNLDSDNEATITLDNVDCWISSFNLDIFLKILAFDICSGWIDVCKE